MSAQSEAAFRRAYDHLLSLWTTPPESRDVETPSARTRVQVWGKEGAPPLVLLHGFKVSSGMWAANALELGKSFRVYAVDLPGDHGLSVPHRPITRVEQLLGWLDELLTALGLSRTNLGGMSYGGWLTAQYAARAPERVSKLVMIAPGATFVRFNTEFALRGFPFLFWKRRAWVHAYMRWAAVPPKEAGGLYDAVMSGISDVMWTGLRHFGWYRGPWPAVVKEEVLRRIQVPALLLVGQQERIYDAETVMIRARSLVPGIVCETIPDASHDLPVRQPEVVAERLRAFIGA
ncbi:alpha/beta fold hydrolase [Archangium lipolyticum]|uniref:alpha/beta fold hydrolase n=1 Tax=Archangium lipolyticum TaxID=2970465 RepID=UPI00214A1BDC|nr:alpha/beta hydrolase [Archangium lipolyticum]